MKIKGLKILILSIISLLLTGCWDYVGLDKITVVSGFAIDIGKKEDSYKLTFEIMDFAHSIKDRAIKTMVIEAEGETILDAIRNARRRAKSKLYFSHAQVVILSKDVVNRDGIGLIINTLARDEEFRETANVIISDEKTAKELLLTDGIGSTVVSYEIKNIVKEDNDSVSSTKNIELYRIFDAIKDSGDSLVMPLFKVASDNGKKIVETNGISLFKGGKIIGKLTKEESKYYLFIGDCVKGGIISLKKDIKNLNHSVLEIRGNRTNKDFEYEDGNFIIKININTNMYFDGTDMHTKPIDVSIVKKIETEVEKEIEKNIYKLINKIKEEYKGDFFGFGHMIYDNNPKLWSKIKKDWNQLFVDAKIEVHATVNIENAAMLK